MLQGDTRDLDATAQLAASAMTAHAERHRREFSSKLSARIIGHDQDDDEEHRVNTHRSKIRKVSPRNVSVVAGSTPSSVSSNGDEEGDDGDVDEDAFVAARTNATRKSALPAAHELKHLRHEASMLEREFHRLCAKWRAQLPDERVLLRACEAAKEKTVTIQVERMNAELKQQLLQQQLFFSSFQSNLSDSPLWQSNKTCQGIFHDIHHELRLHKSDEATRSAALLARFEAARREAPGVMDKYTRDVIRTTTPSIPYSQTGTSGTDQFTFLSSVFVCKIPRATLHEVFLATIDQFTRLTQQLARHADMQLTSTPICSFGESLHYSQLEYQSGVFAGVRSNVTFQAEFLSDKLAIMVIDFVEADELYPHETSENYLRKDGVSMFTLTPVVDELTGQNCILLRRLLVHRYNLLSNSSRLHNEVNSMATYLNGDLPMAMICQALQANSARPAPKSD